MIAAISMMRKRADITEARFRAHWLDPHGVMTAELPGLRSYWQSHCIEASATNALARETGILGFPILWFDDYAARRIAYTSTRIAECNVDSEHFVGAVKRLVTEPSEVVRPHLIAKAAKVIVLAVGGPDPAWPEAFRSHALSLPGVVAVMSHRLLEQAAAPNSKIPELGLDVAGFAEVTFASDAARDRSARDLTARPGDAERIAVYAVEDFRLR